MHVLLDLITFPLRCLLLHPDLYRKLGKSDQIVFDPDDSLVAIDQWNLLPSVSLTPCPPPDVLTCMVIQASSGYICAEYPP